MLCHPSYHLVGASPLPLDMGYFFFFSGTQHFVNGCSAVSCNFGVLNGEDKHTSFYSAILFSILESKGVALLTKVHIVKPVTCAVVKYECESWTIKKVEHQRTDAFELWCWRRLMRVPWTTRGSNQSILKKINPKYLLEVLMLNLKLHDFSHLMQRTDLLEKTLMLGKIKGRRIGDDRGRDGWMASLTQWA